MVDSICLVRLSALGDVLMFVPLVRALQQHYPNASLTWVISPFAHQLVSEMDGIEFIILDKPNALKDYWRFWRQMRQMRFDVLLAAQASLRANLLYPLIRAKRKIGYDKARAKDGHQWFIHESIEPGRDHTLEGFLKFGRVLGLPDQKPEWRMPIDNAAYDWAREHIEHKPAIVVNPAASKPERSWSVASYIKVIQYIQSRFDVQIVLTGGPDDKVLGDEISASVEVTNLIGQTKPKQLLALIDLATLVLCPDTGPGHMASAMNTKAVALHAVTNPDISAPYSSRQHAINAYPEALKRCSNQSVEDARWGTQVHKDWAMELVSVDKVIAKVGQLLINDYG